MVAYSSTQTGDWDNVATWGGGGFPTIVDTWTINNTHLVSVKGTEGGGGGVINTGGRLRFDGQSDTIPAILNVPNSGQITNNGVIDELGTGSTGYAAIRSNGTYFIVNNVPEMEFGYWKLKGIEIGSALITKNHGSTIEIEDSTTVKFDEGYILAPLDNLILGTSSILRIQKHPTVGVQSSLHGNVTPGTSKIVFQTHPSLSGDMEPSLKEGLVLYDVEVDTPVGGDTVTLDKHLIVEGTLTGTIQYTAGKTTAKVYCRNLTMTNGNDFFMLHNDISVVIQDEADVVHAIRRAT